MYVNFFQDLIDIDLQKSMGIYNSTDEFFCLFLNKIHEENKKNILVVVNSIYEANKLYNSLSNYNDGVSLFPMDDFLTSEALAASPELMINRLETINKIVSTDRNIVITNLMGYLRYLPTKDNYLKSIIDLKVGDVISPSKLVERLVSIGYSRDTIVNKTGEFGVRGYIIDIFPIYEDNPIRIEFFDDEIDSIRYFDTDSQKSISKVDNISIKPFFEFITDKEVNEEEFNKQKYLPNYGDVSNIGGYLSDCITVFKDYNDLKLSYVNILEETVVYKEEKDIDFTGNYMFDIHELKEDYPMYYYSLNNMNSNDYVSKMYNFNVKTINNFHENSENINDFINSNIHNGKTVLICLKKFQIRSILKHLNMKIV